MNPNRCWVLDCTSAAGMSSTHLTLTLAGLSSIWLIAWLWNDILRMTRSKQSMVHGAWCHQLLVTVSLRSELDRVMTNSSFSRKMHSVAKLLLMDRSFLSWWKCKPLIIETNNASNLSLLRPTIILNQRSLNGCTWSTMCHLLGCKYDRWVSAALLAVLIHFLLSLRNLHSYY